MKQLFTTRITQLLGVDHPVVCGGMTTVGRAELAAAVSNAGALGMVVGLIDDIPNCSELVERIVAEAAEIVERGLPGKLAG